MKNDKWWWVVLFEKETKNIQSRIMDINHPFEYFHYWVENKFELINYKQITEEEKDIFVKKEEVIKDDDDYRVGP